MKRSLADKRESIAFRAGTFSLYVLSGEGFDFFFNNPGFTCIYRGRELLFGGGRYGDVVTQPQLCARSHGSSSVYEIKAVVS